MINNISFVEMEPRFFTLRAFGVYAEDEIASDNMGNYLSEVLQRFPSSPAVEILNSTKDGLCRTVVARLGRKSKSSFHSREEGGAAIWKKIDGGTEEVLLFDLRQLGEEGLDLLSGFLLAAWRFDKYRSFQKAQDCRLLCEIVVLCNNAEDMKQRFQVPYAAVQGTLYARALTSEPPNQLPPLAYANKLKELEALGVGVQILERDALEAAGMSALLAVSQGSSQHPAVAILTWNGDPVEEENPIVIVGKGVCFDSGGLCLKPIMHQYEMKWDKAGAGTVAGLIKALALAKAEVSVVGILGLVENMPDGAAIKPGDVINTASGKTVEIVNTDAEGRLVLADCLWYAQERFNPSLLIDLGTLTMETFASLGTLYAALYCNKRDLAASLMKSGECSGEFLWELPMGPYFAKQIESSVADIKNLGVEFFGENGAAAEFLRCFVKEGVSWAHLDIAGVAWTKEDLPLAAKGVTGFGVRLLLDWILKSGNE
jgi:leucyl aminopeptidase